MNKIPEFQCATSRLLALNQALTCSKRREANREGFNALPRAY